MKKIMILMIGLTFGNLFAAIYEGPIVDIRIYRDAQNSAGSKYINLKVDHDNDPSTNPASLWIKSPSMQEHMLSLALTAYTTGKEVSVDYDGSTIVRISFKQ